MSLLTQQEVIITEKVRKALQQSGNLGDVKLILASQVVVSGHFCGVFTTSLATFHLPNHCDLHCEKWLWSCEGRLGDVRSFFRFSSKMQVYAFNVSL